MQRQDWHQWLLESISVLQIKKEWPWCLPFVKLYWNSCVVLIFFHPMKHTTNFDRNADFEGKSSYVLKHSWKEVNILLYSCWLSVAALNIPLLWRGTTWRLNIYYQQLFCFLSRNITFVIQAMRFPLYT